MTGENPLQNLTPDDATTTMMVYTRQNLSWGKMIYKKALLPGRALVGVSVPDFLSLYEAQSMLVVGGQIAKPVKYSELHIPEKSILAYHLMPPAEDKIDYDPTTKNRVMTPLTIHVGSFHFNASLRTSDVTTVKNTLDIIKSVFISVYEVNVCHPTNPNMKPIQINMAYVRGKYVLFGIP